MSKNPSELLNQLKTPPKIGKNVFIAPNATLIGTVELQDFCSVWFGAVVRGDSDLIQIGERSNIQDQVVLHADPGYPCVIGPDCVVGHSAIVHGATLEHHVLIGMHATVMNGAHVGAYSIVGAHALIPANMVIPPYSLVLGMPAKIVKTLGQDSAVSIQNNVDEYVNKAQTYIQLYQELKD
jgi:carbonic anhydrase/acetyltransferase-like protein (isoleucine patch superfamily)